MAPSESAKRGSNVTSLDEVRATRAKPTSRGSGDKKVTDPTPQPDATNMSAAGGDTGVDPSMTEQVEISLAGKATRISKRRFDRTKVDRIKAELAAGSYQIDHFSVADKFIEHERYS